MSLFINVCACACVCVCVWLWVATLYKHVYSYTNPIFVLQQLDDLRQRLGELDFNRIGIYIYIYIYIHTYTHINNIFRLSPIPSCYFLFFYCCPGGVEEQTICHDVDVIKSVIVFALIVEQLNRLISRQIARGSTSAIREHFRRRVARCSL